MNKLDLLALDLEGTLISNGMSVFPRPGIHAFLELCAAHSHRLVSFTSLSPERARHIAHVLASHNEAPAWFADLDVIEWEGPHKDLRLAHPTCLERAYRLDDYEGYVHPDQRAQWIPVRCFEPPYSANDDELQRLGEVIVSLTTDARLP